MKTTLTAALLCVAILVLHSADSPQVEALRKQFPENKAKAEQGDAAAQYNLGRCFYGGHGVGKDFVEAYAWYGLVIKRREILFQKARGILENEMSPEQVAAGKKRTEELRAQIAAKRKSGGK